uniref:Uncharacterized protein n=1 Tax=Moniliophthora roreri TaxID=221103 RepID=A0A0W0G0E5_MONRR
MLCTLLLCIVL